MHKSWWYEEDDKEDFCMSEAKTFLAWALTSNGVWLICCCWLFLKFWRDPIYKQPTLRAFMPLVVGNFVTLSCFSISWGHTLIFLEDTLKDGPDGLLKAKVWCAFSYVGYASSFIGIFGLAFTAWVPLHLVRCAKEFQMLQVPNQVIAKVCGCGFAVGALVAALHLIIAGPKQYRGATCHADITASPVLTVVSAAPFWVVLGTCKYFYRRESLEMEALATNTHVARLKKKAGTIKKYSLLFIGNHVIFTFPFLLGSVLEGLRVYRTTKVEVTLMVLSYFGQVMGTMFLLFAQARVQKRKKAVKNQDLMTTFLASEERRTLDLGELHNRGVSLHFLHWFVRQHKIDHKMTVGEVMQKLVKGATREKRCNYAEYIRQLKDQQGGHWAVERPAYFVSHAWGDTFMNLLEQLTLFYRHKGKQGTLYFWIDIFAINQHDEGIGAELARMDTVIDRAQAVLLTLNPWNAPQTLNRVWCLWEVLKAVQKDREIVPIMPGFEEAHFMHTMKEDREKILCVLDRIEVQNAKATVASDRRKIFGEIEETVGFKRMNEMLKGNLEVFLKGIAVDRAVAGVGAHDDCARNSNGSGGKLFRTALSINWNDVAPSLPPKVSV